MNSEVKAPSPELHPAWQYQSSPRLFDEVLEPGGKIRAHWRPFAESLSTIGHEGLAKRWQDGVRLMHDHGVTYNIYNDPQSTVRPWPIDPIPFLLSPGEWRSIEAAVTQRATLLNAILGDLYGPQHLLHENHLPPDLLYPNPGFQRACRGIQVPNGIHLHMYAADIARAPNGKWWVIADRTQAPSGAGYALENRLVSNTVLPDLFRSAHVHRLAGFFQAYRNTLLSLVPRQRENPRIVLLTPGPYNETYFEHAFLARYLGFTLVEGGDLAVHDNRVYLKTLGGLLPVDVIVRRQDDSFCDPLELNAESILGVPGLVQAARSGNVVVANALGSGLIESAAFSAFLPSLSEHILQQDLAMPSVATWWCGDKAPLAYVLDNLDTLVIKPTFPAPKSEPVFPARLSAAQKSKLRDRILAAPASFVAQEMVALSTIPVWDAGHLDPRHMVLRVYAIAHNNSYQIMPGGLTRITSSLENLVVSMQQGGGSKDTWVLSDTPSPEFSLLQSRTHTLEISRATFDLPSRVADNLFWLGRYTERVESAVRILRTLLSRLFQESGSIQSSGVLTGVPVLAALGYLASEPNPKTIPPAQLERELFQIVNDPTARGSLVWNLHHVRRIAWLLRDRISSDAWRILNQLDQQFSAVSPNEPLKYSAALERLNHAVITLSAFSGMVMESMTRGDGWRFLDIGRRMERAFQMTELLHHGLAPIASSDAIGLQSLLEISDTTITYRSRYLNSMQPEFVLDLLLVDEANPRSVAFQFARLSEHISELPESQTLARRPAEARIALELLTNVQLAQVLELIAHDTTGRRTALETFLTRIGTDLRILSETITRRYFNHAIAARRLTAP